MTWLEMIRRYEEINGDPFAPFPASMDYTTQVEEVKCYGCDAAGSRRWPNWELEMRHDPDCAWMSYRAMLAESEGAATPVGIPHATSDRSQQSVPPGPRQTNEPSIS
jgi:hypothetical protein